MLVGDPQQLSPVILLHPADNERLKKIYSVTEEYDYIKNSIYKTYLACDAVSEEILLSHHYRCNEKIIAFNNQKYYNNKLVINSQSQADTPLIFKNIAGNTTNYKNTAPREAEEIIEFIKDNPDKSIGCDHTVYQSKRADPCHVAGKRYERCTMWHSPCLSGGRKGCCTFFTCIDRADRAGHL